MAPHRKARANQTQPPPQPSDYETDAPPAVDVPLPPPRSNEELNFSVLRREYADLLSIEHVTPYAALYTFNLETQSWEKMGIEGTLFICQLTPSPIGAERYCAIILNRRGLDNFYQELTSSEEMEISDPYVIIQGEQVYGIWIFADPPPASTSNCRVETAAKMMDIADRARASREALEPTAQATEPTEAASSACANGPPTVSARPLRPATRTRRRFQDPQPQHTTHAEHASPAARICAEPWPSAA